MGMSLAEINMLSLGKRSWKEYDGKKLLMLGKQKVYCTYQEFFDNSDKIGFDYNKDFLIGKNLYYGRSMDSSILFGLLGFSEVLALDMSAYEGADILFDLRNPSLPPELEDRFDIIFDGGTLEHIIDPIRAMDNICKMLKIGGMVLHMVPSAQMVDHGVYSFSPTFFKEYYQMKGFFINHLNFFIFQKGKLAYCSPDCRSINCYQYVNDYCNLPNAYTLLSCQAIKDTNLVSNILEEPGMYQSVYQAASCFGKERKPLILKLIGKYINDNVDSHGKAALYGYGETAMDIIDYLIAEDKQANEKISCIFHREKTAGNYRQIPIIELNQLKEYSDIQVIFIASLSKATLEIYERLKYLEKKGIQIIKLYELNE